MQVIVNSLLTSYCSAGNDDRTILLLHGWGDSQETFRSLAEYLARTYKVVSIDLPGFGGSQAPAEAWGLSDYASFVASFLAKINTEPYAIIGHSNGGAIAVQGLVDATLSAEKLVLVASAGIRGTKEQGVHRALWKAIAKVGKVSALLLPRATRQRLRQKLYAAAGSDMLVAEHMQETFKRVVLQDVRSQAAKLILPTLLLYGTDDTATPPAYGKMFADLIRGSKLIVMPRTGHFLHQEKAAEVADAVEEFLR
jgi:pimeloyl-ACP methyl ester carboxylesterase